MQNDLQPPYCDAQSPTLISQQRPTIVTHPINLSSTTTTISTSKSKTQKNNNDLHLVNFSTKSSRVTPSLPIAKSHQEVYFKKILFFY